MVFETILGMDAENVLQGRQKVKNMNDQKTLYRAGTQDSKIFTSFFLPSVGPAIHSRHPSLILFQRLSATASLLPNIQWDFFSNLSPSLGTQ